MWAARCEEHPGTDSARDGMVWSAWDGQALQEQARRYGAGEGVDKDMDKALEIQMQAQEQRELDLRHQS